MIEIGFSLAIGIAILVVCFLIGSRTLDEAKLDASEIRRKAKKDADSISCKAKEEAKKKAEEEVEFLINEGKEVAINIIKQAKEQAEFIRELAEGEYKSAKNCQLAQQDAEPLIEGMAEQILKKNEALINVSLEEDKLRTATEEADRIIEEAFSKSKELEDRANATLRTAAKEADRIIEEACVKAKGIEDKANVLLNDAKQTAEFIKSKAKEEAEDKEKEIKEQRDIAEKVIKDAEEIQIELKNGIYNVALGMIQEESERLLKAAEEEANLKREFLINEIKDQAKSEIEDEINQIKESARLEAKKFLEIDRYNFEQYKRSRISQIDSMNALLDKRLVEFEDEMKRKENEFADNAKGLIEKAYRDRAVILEGINVDDYLISIGAYNIVKENMFSFDSRIDNDSRINELKSRLKKIKERQSAFKKAHKGNSCYVHGNANKTYLCDGVLSLGTMAFDVLCENITRTVIKDGIDSSVNKITHAVKLCETKLLVYGSYSNSKAQYYEDYVRLRIEEIKTTYNIHAVRESIKEEARVLREQQREEVRAQREYEREMKKAREDEVKALAALEKARAEAEKEKENKEKFARLQEKIAGLEEALQEAIKRGERAQSMAQLTRHGTVYVISNIGSFGEGVYKIGLTRRLEPLERVHELGDASVPFPFDVHALIESDDAPALETALHQAFADKKLNAINGRKEFFRVPLEEIKNKVKELGHETEWNDIPCAPQYRDSLYFRENR